MPRSRATVPKYCLHKASGRAVVRIEGRDIYLGPHGSDESYSAYQRQIAEWQALRNESSRRQKALPQQNGSQPALTVAQVLVRYHQFALDYYSRGGKPTKEFFEMGSALRVVRTLYGQTRINEFGPLKLKAARQQMVDSGLSRGVVNHRINRVKRFFNWAVSEELAPPSVSEGLRTVTALRKGRTTARETDPITPVDDDHVDAILPYVSPQVAAMIRLQRLTGMRPCEVVSMRVCDINRSRDIWVYTPADHKNAWRGQDRTIPIGPQAQQLVLPFLEGRDVEAYLFSPQEAEARRQKTRREERKSPMTPSQRRRKPRLKPKRAKREYYDTASYRRAIKYGLQKLNRVRAKEGLEPIPNWFPLQLRHSRATELNALYGIEAAAVSLGHAHADVTKVYAERNLRLAIDVARKSG